MLLEMIEFVCAAEYIKWHFKSEMTNPNITQYQYIRHLIERNVFPKTLSVSTISLYTYFPYSSMNPLVVICIFFF